MSAAKKAAAIITGRQEFAGLCQTLRQAGVFGFDTEFIRERSYRPQLCLLQVATPDRVALVDPFQVDTREFWQIVADPAVVKVVHAGNQDLEIGYLHTQLVPANIFDVQVAAALAGLHYPLPYGKLVHSLLGVRAPQDHTVSDWSRRPLSSGQIEYAVADVAYLLGAHDKLRARLDKLARLDWLREEMLPLEAASTYAADPRLAYLRVRGHERLRPREMAVLRELVDLRDQGARAADLPVRTFLKDEVLVAVARRMPQTLNQLDEVRGFPTPLIRQIGQAILDAVRAGQQVQGDLHPRAGHDDEDDPANRMLVDLACAAGQSLCLSGQLNHALLACRGDYADLVRALRRGTGKPAKEPDEAKPDSAPDDQPRLLAGWRRRFAGDRLADLLRGHAALRVKGLHKKPALELDQP